MRYLFITGQLNAGGAERVLLDMLNNFDFDRNEVTLLQVVGGGTLADEIPSQVEVVEAWTDYDLSYKIAIRLSLWFGVSLKWRDRMFEALGGKKYDVAISFLEGMPLKAHSLITDLANRNYSWVHCDLNKFRYETSMFRGEADEIACYQKMDAVINVSNDAAVAFTQRFPITKNRVKVIYNPIDFEKIQRMASHETVVNELFTILFLGRFSPPKKPDRALRLARRLKDEGLKFKLQMIGDGELRPDLEQMAKDLDVTDVVDFLGFIRNPFPYVKAADLLLSTSGWEGFSLVICEAMTLGTPVVSTRTAGPTEIIGHNQYGILCDHDDEHIYEAVKDFMENPEQLGKYIKTAQLRVREFSVENTLQSIYKL